MTTLDTLLIIAFAALIHSSFQLSISMLTLLSSHTIGARRSHTRLVRLTSSFVFGVCVMTILVMSTTALIANLFAPSFGDLTPWVGVCGLLFGLGISVWLFYYRREQGTTLWVPRPLARYLGARAKATKQSAEAFSLGLTSVLAELLFIIVPIVASVLLLLRLDPMWQLVGVLLYGLISTSSLLVVYMLIGGGHKLSRIQKWREDNKQFLQFAAGGGLLVLGFYLYVDQVVTPSVLAAAGGL